MPKHSGPNGYIYVQKADRRTADNHGTSLRDRSSQERNMAAWDGADATGSAGNIGSEAQNEDTQSPEDEYDRLSSYPDSIDYYSLLDLPRNPPPTDAQIRSAYKTLTLSFHPDKQPPELREAATRQYDRIRTAYETLLDPQKRVVYDLLGEEGVKQEWGPGGSMGRAGLAETREVGVKAMDASQFRRWFLMKMKRREREAVQDMVQAKGLVQVTTDARSMFYTARDGSPSIRIPELKPFSYSLGFTFSTPFSPLTWLRGPKDNESEEEKEEREGKGEPTGAEEAGLDKEDNQLIIRAGFGGKLQRPTQQVELEDQHTGEVETREIELPYIVISKNISLGTTLRHTIQGTGSKGPAFSRPLMSFLEDAVVEVSSSIFPSLALTTGISKSFTPVKNTRPLNIALQTNFTDSPLRFPPILNLSVQRQIGLRNVVYSNWSSGSIFWPDILTRLFSLGPPDEDSLIFNPDTSKFELGYVSFPKRQVMPDGANTGEEDEDTFAKGITQADSSGEQWGCLLHSSPGGLQVSFNYGRDLFSRAAEEIPRSEWTYDGYQPAKPSRAPRPVRLELTTTVGLDLSLGWEISGARQVSDFTRLSLGVGLQGHQGLVFSFQWSRLGQRIKLPVLVCPMEYITADLCALAVVLPWATYSAIEFGYLRPRERRQRRRDIARERKRLSKRIAKWKSDSDQAISLMSEHVKRRQAKEADRDGLVILHAEYGCLTPRGKERNKSNPETVDNMADVTVPVAALVDQGQLVIPREVNKSQILGFYDPAPLQPKTLRIRYLFSGREHFVEADDSEAVACPMRSHLVG